MTVIMTIAKIEFGGYTLIVTSKNSKEAKKALKAKYKELVRHYPDERRTFNQWIDYAGYWEEEVELNEVINF